MKKYSQNSIAREREQKQRYPEESLNQVDSIVTKQRENIKQMIADQKTKEKQMKLFAQSIVDTVIEFQLFFSHMDPKSQELDAILNYYKVGYKRNQNPLFIDNIKAQFPKLKDVGNVPILKVQVSLDPVKFVVGSEEIIKFLLDNGFIFQPKHMTYSAYAQQGIEFAKKVDENLEILFFNPILTGENIFKSHPETYREGGKNYILVKALRQLIGDIFINSAKNIRKIYQNKEQYKNSRKQFIEDLESWKIRVGDNDYHGGKSPDEADFAFFGVLMAKHNSRSFQMFLEKNMPGPVYRWFLRMRQNCQYEPDRLLFDSEDLENEQNQEKQKKATNL